MQDGFGAGIDVHCCLAAECSFAVVAAADDAREEIAAASVVIVAVHVFGVIAALAVAIVEVVVAVVSDAVLVIVVAEAAAVVDAIVFAVVVVDVVVVAVVAAAAAAVAVKKEVGDAAKRVLAVDMPPGRVPGILKGYEAPDLADIAAIQMAPVASLEAVVVNVGVVAGRAVAETAEIKVLVVGAAADEVAAVGHGSH